FEDLGDKTRLTMHSQFPSPAERDRIIKEYGADKGLVQTLSRLAQHLAPAGTFESREFVITRRFNAPRRLVWDAFTKVEHLRNWWGPKGFSVVKASLDLKPGGVFHYGLRAPNGAEMWGKWVFREIVAPERLVIVASFSDAAGGLTRHPMAPDWPLQ